MYIFVDIRTCNNNCIISNNKQYYIAYVVYDVAFGKPHVLHKKFTVNYIKM